MNPVPVPAEVFYSQRLVVFLETKPQSNIYNQILLTREQFIAFEHLISKMFPSQLDRRRGMLVSDVPLGLDDIKLPSEIKDIRSYPQRA